MEQDEIRRDQPEWGGGGMLDNQQESTSTNEKDQGTKRSRIGRNLPNCGRYNINSKELYGIMFWRKYKWGKKEKRKINVKNNAHWRGLNKRQEMRG